MPIFKDVPEWYRERLSKMYRINAKVVLRCPHVMSTNHLIGHGCKYCHKIKIYKNEAPVFYLLNRGYFIRNDAYERFCLRKFVARGIKVETSFEFPTPKITSQHITRIPQFFDPHTGTVYDCFNSEEDIEKNSSIYYIRRAHKICAEYKLRYCQVLITRKEFVIINEQK